MCFEKKKKKRIRHNESLFFEKKAPFYVSRESIVSCTIDFLQSLPLPSHLSPHISTHLVQNKKNHFLVVPFWFILSLLLHTHTMPHDQAPPPVHTDAVTLVQLTVAALQQRCAVQRHLEASYQTQFHSSRTPSISMWDYVRRIAKYSGCSPECFIIALLLMDRYTAATAVPLTFRNVHRLTITSVMVSAKLRDDIYYSNAYYASIGGVQPPELNALELELLKTIQWVTWVEPEIYEDFVRDLWAQYWASTTAGQEFLTAPSGNAVPG